MFEVRSWKYKTNIRHKNVFTKKSSTKNVFTKNVFFTPKNVPRKVSHPKKFFPQKSFTNKRFTIFLQIISSPDFSTTKLFTISPKKHSANIFSTQNVSQKVVLLLFFHQTFFPQKIVHHFFTSIFS